MAPTWTVPGLFDYMLRDCLHLNITLSSKMLCAAFSGTCWHQTSFVTLKSQYKQAIHDTHTLTGKQNKRNHDTA